MGETGFKDHFSGHAGRYAAHRPGYPAALFAYLADLCESHDLAWDCATGNGQAARSLAGHFERVIATDASSAQVGSAAPHPGIEFTVARAEDSGIPAAAADLVTVAQALHWFDVDRFFAEALRVLRPGGVLAIWSYARCSVGAGCDAVIEDVFAEVEDYWPPERIIVENHYRDIDLPMPAVETPSFEMHVAWTADHMLDYMRTWSAASRYAAERGTDPVTLHEAALRSSWGEGSREVRWPLTIMAGRKPGASNE